ncbi:MAG: hypothetical protein GY895_05935, partial [Phycisphaera sp.]|nr:hypothetical protein [Phycisphaera sp.]
DLFARGIPWGRAIATHPALASAMNGSPKARISILAISFAALFAMLAIVAWVAGFVAAAGTLGILAVVGLGVWVHLESTLFGLMSRHRGRRTAIGGLGFHAIHHLTVPAACLLGVVLGRWAVTPGGIMRRRNVLGWLLIGWGPAVLSAAIIGAAMIAGASAIQSLLVDMESNIRGLPIGTFEPRFDEIGVQRVLLRLPVFLLPFLLFGSVVSWAGPCRMAGVVTAVLSSVGEALRLRSGIAIAAVLLTGLLLFAVVRSGGVPMRTDEAATVMSHGLANPVAIMGRYQTPNNHMLHSLFVWASIRCFGIEPWAVRLPAMLVSLCCVPLIAAAATRLRGEFAGLVAAVIFVCLPSTTELASNARGYPIVIAAMLVMVALLPAVARNRPGAGIGFALAGAVGLMAVPIMAYPLGLLYSGLFIGRWRRDGLGKALRCVPLAMLTVLVAVTWYLPAWIAASGDGPIGTVARHLP